MGNLKRRVLAILPVALVVACGSETPGGPSKPVELTTSVGVLTITGTDVGDRFPPACSGAGCSVAQSGYQVLIVWLAAKDGSQPNIIPAARDVYVTSASGAQTRQSISGLYSSRLFVAFTPAASERQFKLHWPGNPPAELGR